MAVSFNEDLWLLNWFLAGLSLLEVLIYKIKQNFPHPRCGVHNSIPVNGCSEFASLLCSVSRISYFENDFISLHLCKYKN